MNYRKLMAKQIRRALTKYEVVHHVNKDVTDNRLENLMLMSLSDHSSMHMSGRKLPIETKDKLRKQSRRARPSAILSIEDVRDVRKMLRNGIKQRLIAFAFGVDRKTITSINTGDTWLWVN